MNNSDLEIKLKENKEIEERMQEQKTTFKTRQRNLKEELENIQIKKQELLGKINNADSQIDKAVREGKETREIHEKIKSMQYSLDDFSRREAFLRKDILNIELELIDIEESLLKRKKDIKSIIVSIEMKKLEKIKALHTEQESKLNKARFNYSVADNAFKYNEFKEKRKKLKKDLENIEGGE